MSWIITCLTVWAPMRPMTDSGTISPLRGDGDVAGRAVERHCELAGVLGVELLAQPGRDRLLDVGVDLLALDVLVAGDAVDDADQFWIHAYSSLLCYSVVRLFSCPARFTCTTTSTDTPVQTKKPPHIRAAHCFDANL